MQMYCNLLMMYDTRYDFIFEVDMNYFILGQGRDMSECTIIDSIVWTSIAICFFALCYTIPLSNLIPILNFILNCTEGLAFQCFHIKDIFRVENNLYSPWRA